MNAAVKDCFEIKGRSALEYGAEGVVVICQHEPGVHLPAAGDPVLLVRPDGWIYSGKAEDVRNEPAGAASGLFLRGLHKDDVPIGSQLRWGKEALMMQNAVA